MRKFFASVDHEVLLGMLDTHIRDADLLTLLGKIVQSFSVSPGKGLPLGNLTSQLFANVYMDAFDRYVKHGLGIRWYVRYADDFVVLSHDRAALIDALTMMRRFLVQRLHLELHPQKVSLTTLASGVDFLGWVHFPHHRVPRTSTKRRARKHLCQQPSDKVLQSYLGLFSHGDAYELRQRLLSDYFLWSLSTSLR